ncbi:MAG: type II toxin-antitoxin system HicB family antitoxin [Gemmatimonadetes bacterium]|nr:type II toxin-antitoxin system HicB family antitoxin [Candidatus Latescibacterota bacterium]MCY4604334.1 type II toxin-antitoxin system HicB family antitoxin [Gemmatimonadota bacterium]
MDKYSRVLYWSAEDNAWIAEVPELEFCAADGPTPQGALAEVENAVQRWLDVAREEGWEIPQPKGRLAVG